MDVTVNGLPEIMGALEKLPQKAVGAAGRGIIRATTLVWREAVKNAPRSPTVAQKARATRKTRKDTSSRLNPSAFTRSKPGGLERSISMSTSPANLTGSVFVAANAEAGKYAVRIHDKKGSEWNYRGKGTIAKGPRADDKFIARAVSDNEGKITKIMNDELAKGVTL